MNKEHSTGRALAKGLAYCFCSEAVSEVESPLGEIAKSMNVSSICWAGVPSDYKEGSPQPSPIYRLACIALVGCHLSVG